MGEEQGTQIIMMVKISDDVHSLVLPTGPRGGFPYAIHFAAGDPSVKVVVSGE